MDRISDIQTQTIEKFKQPVYAVNFAVDNNPTGIIGQITEMGYGEVFTNNLNADKQIAKNLLIHWYRNKQTQNILDVLNNVVYVNQGGESAPYTNGFMDYFRENTNSQGVGERVYSNVEQDGMRFSWDGLLSALGAGLTTYGAISGNGIGVNGEPTQEQKDAEEAEKKKKMWTMIAWIIGILVLLALIVILYKYFNKNK